MESSDKNLFTSKARYIDGVITGAPKRGQHAHVRAQLPVPPAVQLPALRLPNIHITYITYCLFGASSPDIADNRPFAP